MARPRGRVNGSIAEPFIAAVRRTIDRREMLHGGERVVLAVSGGPDSLALLHAMVHIAPERDLTLHVAHLDHRLRPDSADDASFVRAQAEALGLAVTLGTADDTAAPKGKSPEEAARERRYRFLNEVARATGSARIATAHTLDDQAETVLMRVLVGAGRRGLSGIPPKRWYVIRPLIDVRRAEIEAFCSALGLEPRIDPTNADPAFLRNALRNDVLPSLRRAVNDRLPESLARLSDIVRDEDYFLDRAASAAALPEETDSGARLSIDRLRAVDPALQRRAIRLLARVLGPGIDHAHTEAVRKLALEGSTGDELHLSGGLKARLEYGFLVVGRTSSLEPPPSPVELAVPGETDLLPWGIAMRSWITVEPPASLPDGSAECVLDVDRVTLPLRVRPWQTGDRFRPLGMKQEKKVGDFFTDEKVPKAERAGIALVEDGAGTICWIVGHRIDDRVKVTAQTRSHLWLQVEEGTT